MKAILWFVLCSLFIENISGQELKGDGWFQLPFRTASTELTGACIYFVGGYNSIDAGTPPWGSIVEADNLYVGDKAGDIIITYHDGTTDAIPLIFGYTMWFRAHWIDGGAPFKTASAEPDMTACLEETLHLQGAFEGKEQTVLKVRIQAKPVAGIEIVDNPLKRGEPVFTGGYLLQSDVKKELTGGPAVNSGDSFFDAHTLDSHKPFTLQANIEKIRHRLYTFEPDFENVLPFVYPEAYKGAKISFSGNTYAHILTRVFHDNMEDIRTKMRDDGMIDESSPGAPSWRYDGFGTWVPDANSYYGSMYSRNRSLGILSYLGLLEQSQKSVDFLNKWLMYYPDHKLTMLGKAIPGHWSVIPNKPFIYSKELTVVAGWPTRYTKERFGEDYQNFGNSEPDGHGLTMMSIANVWLNGGAKPQWVSANWKYIREAVHYIDWAMKNPDVSFNEHGLMYGESEGGMMEFTLFNNVPCWLGVRMYADMASAAGRKKEAADWSKLAGDMEKSILTYFRSGDQWRMDKFGFFHDPSLAIYADYAGYDAAADVPETWYRLSRNTYEDDRNKYIGTTFMGVRGLGYDHNIITQTSLLLDKCDDYDKFVTNLSKLCYSPRLPKPFIVPEAASYSREHGMYRRQGDLGNYVQQNETVRTILMVAGISKARDKEVKIMPRLPKGWSVDIDSLTIPGTDACVNCHIDYPVNRSQSAVFRIENKGRLEVLKFRAGPFASEHVIVNDRTIATEQVGDARWAWVEIEHLQNGKEYKIKIDEN